MTQNTNAVNENGPTAQDVSLERARPALPIERNEQGQLIVPDEIVRAFPHEMRLELALAVDNAHEVFSVTDIRTANWVMQRIFQEQDYRKQVADYAAAEKKASEKREERLLFLYEDQMQAIADSSLQLLSNNAAFNKKTVALPSGRLGYQSSRETVEVEGEEGEGAFWQWWWNKQLAGDKDAFDCGTITYTVTVPYGTSPDKIADIDSFVAEQGLGLVESCKVNKAALNSYPKASGGELPDGCVLNASEEKFVIKRQPQKPTDERPFYLQEETLLELE